MGIAVGFPPWVPTRLVLKAIDEFLGIDGHVIHSNLIEGILKVFLNIVKTDEDEGEQKWHDVFQIHRVAYT